MEIRSFANGSKKEMEELAAFLETLPFIANIGQVMTTGADQDRYFIGFETYNLPPEQYKKTWQQINRTRKAEEKQNGRNR